MDDSLVRFLQISGITSEELHEWRQQASQDYALQKQSQQILGMTRDAFRLTHFRTRGISTAAHTQRGTRPGDPIGDVCFNLVTQTLLKDVRKGMHSLGFQSLEEAFRGENGHHAPSVMDVSFFDDIAICVLHSEANQVIQAAAQIVSLLADACRKRGLRVNFKPDKTELLLGLKGQGSRQLKQQIHITQKSTVPIVLEHAVEAVRVAHSYKHLGSYTQSDATASRDARYRVAHARKAWGPLLRPLWTSKYVCPQNKVAILRSLVMSRILYQVHTWSWNPEGSFDVLQNAFKDMTAPLVRPYLGGLDTFLFTASELAGFLSILDPCTQARINRLKFLAWHVHSNISRKGSGN